MVVSNHELLSITRYLIQEKHSIQPLVTYLHQSLLLQQIQQQIQHLQAIDPQHPMIDTLKQKLTQEQQVREKVTILKNIEIKHTLSPSKIFEKTLSRLKKLSKP